MEELKPLSTMTPAEINREFAERAGIHLHQWDDITGKCRCGLYYSPLRDPQPDFYADAREVLKVMMEREDYQDFIKYMESKLYGDWVAELFSHMTTPGLLAKAALQWMRERGK